MAETNTARVYHAFRSPYSRLGLHTVKRAGLSPQILPFDGPPEGVAFNDPTKNKPKLLYYMQDAPRMTMRMGLPISSPKPFDVDFTAANRALAAAGRDGVGLDFAIALSDARWGEGKNVSELDVILAAATDAGWDANKARAAQDDPSVDVLMAEARAHIEKDEVFGVPFAVIGDQKFWGHDRFDLFVEAMGGE